MSHRHKWTFLENIATFLGTDMVEYAHYRCTCGVEKVSFPIPMRGSRFVPYFKPMKFPYVKNRNT